MKKRFFYISIAEITSWSYGMLQTEETTFLKKHLNWLIDQLEEKIEIIIRYKKDFDLECKLVAVIESSGKNNSIFV